MYDKTGFMQKISVVILTSLVLCGCFGSKKVQPVIQFTDLLKAEAPERQQNIVVSNRTIDLEQMEVHKIAGSTIIAQSVIVKDTAYNIDKYGVLSAYNIEQKKKLWQTSLNTANFRKEFTSGGILYVDGTLYVTYGDIYLVAVNAQNGVENMRVRLEGVSSSKPVSIGDVVMVQTEENQLFAYNAALTEPLWRHGVYPEVITMSSTIYPSLYKGNIIAAYSSGHLFSLSAKEGEQIWDNVIDAPKDVLPNYMPAGINVQPLIVEGTVYIATAGGELFKISLDNGQIIWKRNAEDIQAITHDKGTLFIVTNARQVAALSAQDGKVIWATDLINRDLLKKLPEPAMHFAPIAANGVITVYNAEGQQFILDITNGMLLSNVKAPKNISFVNTPLNNKTVISYNNRMMVAK